MEQIPSLFTGSLHSLKLVRVSFCRKNQKLCLLEAEDLTLPMKDMPLPCPARKETRTQLQNRSAPISSTRASADQPSFASHMPSPTQPINQDSEIRSLQHTVAIDDGFVRHVANATVIQINAIPINVLPLQSSTPGFGAVPISQSLSEADGTNSVQFSETDNTEKAGILSMLQSVGKYLVYGSTTRS